MSKETHYQDIRREDEFGKLLSEPSQSSYSALCSKTSKEDIGTF